MAGITGAFLMATAAQAASITVTDRPTLLTALGAGATVEDFTADDHFPITTGVLNSSTNLVVGVGTPITPGLIHPGVTYSTPIGTGFFFNIDNGGGFTGGFLDRLKVNGVTGPLTVAFSGAVAGFGFDTNSLMGPTFTIDIAFNDAPDFTDTLTTGSGSFGFESDGQDIVGATIEGSNSEFEWAIDNFTFGPELATAPVGTPNGVPEPASLAVFGFALAGLGILRRKRGAI